MVLLSALVVSIEGILASGCESIFRSHRTSESKGYHSTCNLEWYYEKLIPFCRFSPFLLGKPQNSLKAEDAQLRPKTDLVPFQTGGFGMVLGRCQ